MTTEREVKRYDFSTERPNPSRQNEVYACSVENEHGNYVKHSDYAALNAKCESLEGELARLTNGVKISIPTETMEQEIQSHIRMATSSIKSKCAALAQALYEINKLHHADTCAFSKIPGSQFLCECHISIARAALTHYREDKQKGG